jgi:hypothetical protein
MLISTKKVANGIMMKGVHILIIRIVTKFIFYLDSKQYLFPM